MLTPPIGLLASLLSRRDAAGSPNAGLVPLPTAIPVQPRETIAGRNLGFVLLAALGDDISCPCRIAATVQESAAVFLTLTHARIRADLQLLVEAGMIDRLAAECDHGCNEAFRVTPAGADYLNSLLNDWRLSRLASDALHTFPREVSMNSQ